MKKWKSSDQSTRLNEENNNFLERMGTTPITAGTKISELLKRTEVTYDSTESIDASRPVLPRAVKEQVEIQVKYEGYIKLQQEQIDRFKKLEEKKIAEDIDYTKMDKFKNKANQ